MTHPFPTRRSSALLAETRGELAVAVVLDRRMQAALDRAVLRLRDARVELAAGKAEMAEQEDVLGQIAVQNYQQGDPNLVGLAMVRSEEHTSELQSLMRNSYAVFCLKKKKHN